MPPNVAEEAFIPEVEVHLPPLCVLGLRVCGSGWTSITPPPISHPIGLFRIK